LDEVYDALILAQSLGVDITDIYMMMNGSCNVWGKYLCNSKNQDMHYTNTTCKDGFSVSNEKSSVRGGAKCTIGQVIPMSDGGCQLIQMLNNNEEVQQNWLYPEDGEESKVRVGCASEALDNSNLFRGRKKQASIDVDTLRRMIEQDAPTRIKTGAEASWLTRYCAVGDDDIYKLQTLVQNKSLTTTGLDKVCVVDDALTALPGPTVISSGDASSTCKDYCNGQTRWMQAGYSSEAECLTECTKDEKTQANKDGTACNPNHDYRTEVECKSNLIGNQTCYWVSPTDTWKVQCGASGAKPSAATISSKTIGFGF
jgi:hypothetical protein